MVEYRSSIGAPEPVIQLRRQGEDAHNLVPSTAATISPDDCLYSGID
jgi:hypothetical protein